MKSIMLQSVNLDQIFGCSNRQNRLCIVTFLRENETISEDFHIFCKEMYNTFDSELLIFCDTPPEFNFSSCWAQIITLPGTKYKRLLAVPSYTRATWILCVDNDVSCNRTSVIQFLSQIFKSSCDAAWGKLDAAPATGLIAKLVKIDKWLSHGILRPLLWKSGLGITLPGQLCLFRKGILESEHYVQDTFLDDLAFGLKLRIIGARVITTSDILGLEAPKCTFSGLWKQRKRWADGFASVFKDAKCGRERLLVLIHGIVYHGLWILGWSVIVFLASVTPLLSLLVLMFLSCLFAKGKIEDIPVACCYQLIFPLLHLRWFFCMLCRLLNKRKI